MKNYLLLQTALVAASLAFTNIAEAQTKEQPIGVTVGGYMTQVYRVTDREKDRNTTDLPSQSFTTPDAEIWFNIRAVLADGTVIGGRVELEGQTETDQIDESYMYVERSDVGRLELGSTDRAASKMVYGAPTAIPGYGTIDPTGNISVVKAPSGARTTGNKIKFSYAGDDAEAINLYTSSNRYFGSKSGKGLQFGFSYVPDGCEDSGCATSSISTANAGQASKIYQFAANYIESFGAFDVALFGAYNRASIEADSVGSASSGSATVFKNSGLDGYAFGTTLTYNIVDGSSVQFGGAYKDEEQSVTRAGDDSRKVYSLGLRYLTAGTKPGSIGVGVDWALSKADQGNVAGTAVAGEDEFTWYSVGVTYQVAQGILTFAGIGRYEFEDAVSAATLDNDSKATFGVVGMRLDF